VAASPDKLIAALVKEGVVRQQILAEGKSKGDQIKLPNPDWKPEDPVSTMSISRKVTTQANYKTLTPEQLAAMKTVKGSPIDKANEARSALVELEGYDHVIAEMERLGLAGTDTYNAIVGGRNQQVTRLGQNAEKTLDSYAKTKSYEIDPTEDQPEVFK